MELSLNEKNILFENAKLIGKGTGSVYLTNYSNHSASKFSNTLSNSSSVNNTFFSLFILAPINCQ